MVSEAIAGEDGGRELNTAAVIGAGTMGRQIASLIAGSGRPVRIWDADSGMLAAARERIADGDPHPAGSAALRSPSVSSGAARRSRRPDRGASFPRRAWQMPWRAPIS